MRGRPLRSTVLFVSLALALPKAVAQVPEVPKVPAAAAKSAEKAAAAQKAAEKAGVAQKAAEKAAEKASVAQKAAEKAAVAQKAAEKAAVAQKAAEKAAVAQKAAEKAAVAQKAAEKAGVAQKAAETAKAVEKASMAHKAVEKAAAAEKSIAAQKTAEKAQAAAKAAAAGKASDKAAVAQKAAEKSVAAEKTAIAQKTAEKAAAAEKSIAAQKAAEKSVAAEKAASAQKAAEKTATAQKPTGRLPLVPGAASAGQKDETSNSGKQRVQSAGADTRRYKKGEGDQASNEGGKDSSNDQAAPPEPVPAAEARAADRENITGSLSQFIDERLAGKLVAAASNADDPDAQETANDRIRDIVEAAALMEYAGVDSAKARFALEQVAKAPDMTYDRVLNRVVGEALIKRHVEESGLAEKFYDKIPEHAKDKGRDVFTQIIAADAELRLTGVAETKTLEVFEKIANSPDDDTRKNEVGAAIIKDKYGEGVFDKIPKGKLDRLHDVATQLLEVEAATTLLGGETPEINAAVSDAAAKGVTTGDRAREVIVASPLYAAASEALAEQLAEATKPASAPNPGTGNDTAAPAPAPAPNPDTGDDTAASPNPATGPAPGPSSDRTADPDTAQPTYVGSGTIEGGEHSGESADVYQAADGSYYAVTASGAVVPISFTIEANGSRKPVHSSSMGGPAPQHSGGTTTSSAQRGSGSGGATSSNTSGGGTGSANSGGGNTSSTNSSGGTTSNTNSSGGSTTNTNSGDGSGDSGDAGGDTDTDASTNNTPPPDDADNDTEGAESRLGPGEREYNGGPSVMGPSFFERLGKAVNEFFSGGAVDPVEHEDNPTFNRNIPVPDAKERLLGDPRVNRALPSGSLQAPGAIDGNVINPDRNDSPAGQPDKTGPVPTPKPLL